jgi:hypothetical protein
MSGNVWEITLGALGASGVLVTSVLTVVCGILVASWFYLIIGVIEALLLLLFLETSEALRGGAWNTSSYQATCFSRSEMKNTMFVGFRCVKEV